MSIFTEIFLLCIFYVLVYCEISNLNVRKLDHQMIAKKRQDTLDMCRIFTEETAKIQQSKPKIIHSYKYIQRSPNIRNKREVEPIETVDKMEEYDISMPLGIRRYKREVSNAAPAADLIKNDTSQWNEDIKKEVYVNSAGNPDLKTKDVRRADGAATTNPVNPALSPQDMLKIENIVDKIYHDLGPEDKIEYRRNPLITSTTTTATTKVSKNTTKKTASRRLFFAPAELKIGKEQLDDYVKIKPNASVYDKARWKHGIIPYFIDSRTYDAQLQESIIKAFDYIEKVTCIRLQKLRERPTDKKSLQEVDWVYITNSAGVRQCVHSNEKRKIDGVQMSVLGYDCMSLGDIVHEVMHILGFSHEHTRSDRDQYISILWDNIKPGYKKYFEISKGGEQYTLENLPYDYSSILHYPPRAFSKNGQITIQTEPGVKIGQREGLSEIDLEKIGAIYSGECVERNKDYLLMTCPSVVKAEPRPVNVSQQDIDEYFRERLWPFGLISYKLRDLEFSTEERENIKAVIDHIEKETCIQFRDMGAEEQSDEEDPTTENISDSLGTSNRNHKEDAENEIGGEGMLRTIVGAKENITTTNATTPEAKRVKRQVKQGMRVRRQIKSPQLSGRRHAANNLILTRSAKPGCKCPKPGKPGENSVLEINADCFNSVNDLLHLFVHVLGLDHQHNMHDRDNYLHIVWENLSPDIKEDLQKKLPPAASVGFPYDYQSVMHYPWLQIKNGVTNIMYPLWNDGWAMGHWQGLSSFDVQKLNLLYFNQCSERQKQSQD